MDTVVDQEVVPSSKRALLENIQVSLEELREANSVEGSVEASTEGVIVKLEAADEAEH